MRRVWTEEEMAYKEVPEHPIKLDFTGCKYIMQFHQILRVQLGLPDYYGNNWDALWDLMQSYRSYPTVIEVYGLDQLPKDLEPAVEDMFSVFRDVELDTPYIQFVRMS